MWSGKRRWNKYRTGSGSDRIQNENPHQEYGSSTCGYKAQDDSIVPLKVQKFAGWEGWFTPAAFLTLNS
jgi:hypothetical protein